MRYTLELANGFCSNNLNEKILSSLSELQDRMGRTHDLVTFESQLRWWIAHSGRNPRRSHLSSELERIQKALVRSRAELAKWWTNDRTQYLHSTLRQLVEPCETSNQEVTASAKLRHVKESNNAVG